MTPRRDEDERRPTVGRPELALRRDAAASERDRIAGARDERSEARDAAAAALDGELGDRAGSSRAARARVWAAADRAGAALDREHAALDRGHAADDRDQAQASLADAQVDGLTGAYLRPLGEAALAAEIARARRSHGRLVLAFVDVDGLKERNDQEGHAAGDALLRSVVGAIRSRVRSYDPVVRFGGDEFVCGLSDTNLNEAGNRFEEIREALRAVDRSASISVGLAALRPTDSVRDLTARGDAALYGAKQEKYAAVPAASGNGARSRESKSPLARLGSH